jgi:hypothetical protein
VAATPRCVGWTFTRAPTAEPAGTPTTSTTRNSLLRGDEITDRDRMRNVSEAAVVAREVVESAADADHGNIMHA